jgi:soluble lytic murein transglycosylase-like protein
MLRGGLLHQKYSSNGAEIAFGLPARSRHARSRQIRSRHQADICRARVRSRKRRGRELAPAPALCAYSSQPNPLEATPMIPRVLMTTVLLILAACSGRRADEGPTAALYPNETPELRALINTYADTYRVPRALVHKVVQRESDYRPHVRNGPNYGLMQIQPATARGMGFRGRPEDLLDAETNLRWAVKYLRGAWIVSDRDMDEAVMWYGRGYYYEARNRCQLVETGLGTREIARHCR